MQFSFSVKEFSLKAFFEIGLILAFLYAIYTAYIRGTQSERLLKGIGMLLGALIFSKILIMLEFQILGRFLETLVSIMLFGLVVIFQPELRRFLGYLGQPGIFSKNIFQFENHSSNLTPKSNISKEIADAVKHLSKTRVGALIVLQNVQENNTMYDVGTRIDGYVSQELLLTIFHPNTALHDGATVICNGKIISAGVLLPLTEDPKLSWRYGTRHRAAIGMSEVSDYLCIVVSEETGNISIAYKGQLITCNDIAEFKVRIQDYLGINDNPDDLNNKISENKKFNLEKLFKDSKKSKAE
jgi:diadenylate cyclase